MPSTLTIRKGSVRVKIFRSRTAIGGRVYTAHEVRWTTLDGRRRRLKRSKLPEARKEAARIAGELAQGGHSAELSIAEIGSFRNAVSNLFGTGKSIDTATADYAAAVRLAPGMSMEDLARFHNRHRSRTFGDITVAGAVDDYLSARVSAGVSDRWRMMIRSHLRKFTATFHGPIANVTAASVGRWVANLKSSAGLALNNRTRNNYLAAVQGLFTHPSLDAHPERRAIARLQPARAPAPTVRLWMPDEFRTLLETARLPFIVRNKRTRKDETHSHAHLIPVLVLGGFAKIRTAEIIRATWENVRLDDAQVLITAGQAKTRRRRLVPLPAAAVAWLRLSIERQGRIWPLGQGALHTHLRALAARCDLTWRENALRKSANTYSMLLDTDSARVSAEAGNSPAILETNYLKFDGITRADAEAWFAILPVRSMRKIVPLADECVKSFVPKPSPIT